MAPLDTGSTTASMLRLVDTAGLRVGPTPNDYDSLGAYLKAVREHRGETLSELAEATRVRGAYLAAIEGGDRAILPSRPFAIGYVRSYAAALGLDGELAVERFKRDWPESSEPLRNPVGVGHEAKASRPLLYALAAVLVVGVGLWNVAQRTLARDSAPASIPALADAPPAAPSGALKIAAPTEAPAESTIPAAYVTPGMDAAMAAANGQPAPADAAKPAAAAPDATPLFVPKGAVHGVAAAPNTVVLQARKPLSLIVHGADQTVYFARQIAAGEAFRAPLGRGLVADVSDPASLDVYVNGRLAPGVAAEPLFLDKIPLPAPAAAAPPPPAAAAPVAGEPTTAKAVVPAAAR
ncbi:MAG: helix-turn-helix domain-containing protein [Caulobacteraceae bacterium]|nr:helix-turn-helix domain-containing protein [Caulobacter sp.]